jgi:hypothetical protein
MPEANTGDGDYTDLTHAWDLAEAEDLDGIADALAPAEADINAGRTYSEDEIRAVRRAYTGAGDRATRASSEMASTYGPTRTRIASPPRSSVPDTALLATTPVTDE